MALQILNSSDRPNPEQLVQQISAAIKGRITDARVEVTSGGPGHYVIRVESHEFGGKPRVKQQQLVYGAIAHLMTGQDAPIHAVDRLECIVPE